MAKKKTNQKDKAKEEEKQVMDGLDIPFEKAMSFLIQKPNSKPSEVTPKKGKDK